MYEIHVSGLTDNGHHASGTKFTLLTNCDLIRYLKALETM